MFNTTCMNNIKCHNGTRYCGNINHNHTKTTCDKTAVWGAIGTTNRTYCNPCFTQLNKFEKIKQDQYEKTNNKCIVCENKGKIEYGIRGYSPTHCKKCSESDLQIINLKSGNICSMVNDNGIYICKMQGRSKINNKHYCTTHANIIGTQTNIEILNTYTKCTIEGCLANAYYSLDSNDSTKATHCKKCAELSKEPFYEIKNRKLCINWVKNNCKSTHRVPAEGSKGTQAIFDCYSLMHKTISAKGPRAFYGLEQGNPLYCQKCGIAAGKDYHNVESKKCEKCNLTRPVWAYGPDAYATRCKNCTPKDDVNWISVNTRRSIVEQIALDNLIKIKGCHFIGCDIKYPSFGYIWKQPTHCKDHKYIDMIDVYTKKCVVKGCNKHKCYGTEWRKPEYCATHGKDKSGYENVISKRCKECQIIASYGSKWQKPTHCMSHGIPLGLNNVVSKKCESVGCSTRATYGLNKSPTHCSTHGNELSMSDVTHIKCFILDCNLRACFGTEINSPEYCYNHKDDDMEDVVHIKCAFGDCSKRPSYGVEFGSATHCISHKSEIMVDVVSKRCEFDDCAIQASYNYEGLMVKYCKTHKEDNMINVKATTCNYLGCYTQASFNEQGDKAKYCFTHKYGNMINVRAYRCFATNCEIQINSNDRYKGYCFNCFYINYPNEPIIRNYKTKEITIMNSISNALKIEIIKDKMIIGSGSKRRPDGLIQLDHHNIVIEIDEHQHKHVGYINDSIRDIEIFNALNKNPLTIIRFNPDRFNGVKNGLFNLNTNTKLVEVIHKERYETAIQELINTINNAILNPPLESKNESDSINVIKLRFDNE